MGSSDFAIRSVGLGKRFKDEIAVTDLNLEISYGEIYSFLGPNGAGKSTTVKMLVTLLSPTSGNAFILGKSIVSDTSFVRLRIGVALQDASLDEAQTGEEFLTLQGRLYGLKYSMIKSRINDLIPLIDIGDFFKKPIKTYSGGMKRRLDLAASLIHNPGVLFLDEPTTGLDPISRAKVWEEVERLNKKHGITIFLTTQYLDEADKLADRVGIINKGKLVVEGTPQQLKQSIGEDLIIAKLKNLSPKSLKKVQQIPGVTKVTLKDNQLTVSTTDGSAALAKVAYEINQDQTVIESLIMRTPTLDDVFLKVTGNSILNKQN